MLRLCIEHVYDKQESDWAQILNTYDNEEEKNDSEINYRCSEANLKISS